MKETRKNWIRDIVAWAQSDSQHFIFWVNGIPGSGKTALAQTIAQHPDIMPLLVSFISFTPDVRMSNYPAGHSNVHVGKQSDPHIHPHRVVELIAYRLAGVCDRVAVELVSRLHKPKQSFRDFFTELILEPLKAAAESGELNVGMVIILDALDQFGTSEDRKDFIQLLSGLSENFPKLPRHLRFLITSRPEADLVDALSSKNHIIEKRLDVNSEESKKDVSAFIKAEMEELASKYLQGSERDENIRKWCDAADGLFLWASTAIQKTRRSLYPSQVLCSLADDEKPSILRDEYKRALESVELEWDEDMKHWFAELFALILPKRRKITVELLDLLLELGGNSPEPHLSKLQSFISYSKQDSIHIHHKTFAHYYLQSSKQDPDVPWYIDVPRTRKPVVLHCFAAMEVLAFDMYGSITGPGNNNVASKEIRPPTHYACLHWADHLKDAGFSSDVLNGLRSFLDERLLFWLEVLSREQEFAALASQVLQHAVEWVSVSFCTFV